MHMSYPTPGQSCWLKTIFQQSKGGDGDIFKPIRESTHHSSSTVHLLPCLIITIRIHCFIKIVPMELKVVGNLLMIITSGQVAETLTNHLLCWPLVVTGWDRSTKMSNTRVHQEMALRHHRYYSPAFLFPLQNQITSPH